MVKAPPEILYFVKQILRKKPTDLYYHDKRLEMYHKTAKREFSESNFALYEKYDEFMLAETLAKATRDKNLQVLIGLTRFLGKDWADVTKDDIQSLVAKINQKYTDERGKETNTSFDQKKILKLFVRWVKLGHRDKLKVGDPPEIQNVRLKKPDDKLSREELISEEDLIKLLHACGGNLRDKAFIDVHYEAATRPGEILNLQLKHVTFDKYGAVIKVDGKTGTRPIRIVRSAPSLNQWIKSHPYNNDKSSPLWISLSRSNFGDALSYRAANKIIKTRAEIAGLGKRVFLNLFRHSSATETANFLTEAQLKKRHGWTKDSKMAGRYTHLVNADVESAILKHYGIVQEETKLKPPKICHVCNFVNDSESSECSNCDKPLDLKTALEKQEMENMEKDVQMKKIENLEKAVEKLVDIVSPSNSSKFLVHADEHKKQLLLQSLQKEHPVVQLDDTRYIIGKHMPALFRFVSERKN